LIRDRLTKLAGHNRYSLAGLQVYPQPSCEVIGMLEKYARAEAPPKIETNKPDGNYTEGEFVELVVTPSPQLDGYLYVDYIDSVGNVVHCWPAPKDAGMRVPRGESIVIGRGRQAGGTGFEPWQDRFQVSPPHGPGVIIAISARRPLFGEAREKQVETANTYLPALRAGLERLKRAEGATATHGTYKRVTTHQSNNPRPTSN